LRGVSLSLMNFGKFIKFCLFCKLPNYSPDKIATILLSPRHKAWGLRNGAILLFAYANYANYVNYSSVCGQHVLVGQWPEWPSSAIVLAAVSGRSAAGPLGPRVSQMIPPP